MPKFLQIIYIVLLTLVLGNLFGFLPGFWFIAMKSALGEAALETSKWQSFIMQIFYSLSFLLVPLFLMKKYYGDTVYLKNFGWEKENLFSKNTKAIRIFFYLSLVLWAALAPLNSFFMDWNASIRFPEAMATLELILRKMEDQALVTTELFLSTNTPWELIPNLLIMAIIPAVTEEFFFRGFLQNILWGWTKKPIFAIIIAALLFSLVHFQFYGFLPRFVLGCIMGYSFYVSKRLWVPMLLHFINNTFAVINYYLYEQGWISTNPIRDAEMFPLWSIAISLVLAFFLIYYISFKRLKPS